MNVNPHTRFLKCQAHTAQHLLSAHWWKASMGRRRRAHHVGERMNAMWNLICREFDQQDGDRAAGDLQRPDPG